MTPEPAATQPGWFEVERIGPGVTMIGEPRHVEHVHSYLIEGERDVAILDTGTGVGNFPGLVRNITNREPLVVQTHAHWDHIGATHAYERVLVHPSESDLLRAGSSNEELRPWFSEDQVRREDLPDDFDLETFWIPGTNASGELYDGQKIDLGGRIIEIHHTPGHSTGSITVFDSTSGLLFPADAVNYGPIYLLGQDADLDGYVRTLERLVNLTSRAARIYPSHYDVPMMADDVADVQAAYHSVLAGAVEPARDGEIDRYRVGRYEFLIDAGRLGSSQL